MRTRWSALGLVFLASTPAEFAAFEVATVKPVDSDLHRGRMFRMEGPHRWIATDYTLKNLIALAYDMNPRTISGGPSWMESQHFEIEAITPGVPYCWSGSP